MLNRGFVAIAMLSIFFTVTALGKKEIIRQGAKNTEQKSRITIANTKAAASTDEERDALVS